MTTLQPSSFRAAYAKHIFNQHLLNTLNEGQDKTYNSLPHHIPECKNGNLATKDSSICIIGAGASGLYLAMMLKHLGFTNVTILEASDRAGGRCYTQDIDGDEYHSYYDVGAMRIPDIPWMRG